MPPHRNELNLTKMIWNNTKLANFSVGDYWISSNRRVYRIIDIDFSPRSYYPLLVEDVETKIVSTAERKGGLFRYNESIAERLIMQVPPGFNPSKTKT